MRRLPHPPKFYQALREAAARRETGLYLIEGSKLVGEALESLPQEAFHAILWRADEELSIAVPASLLYRVEPWIMERVTTLETPPCVIAIAHQKALLPSPRAWPALFLEGLQDPGNVGTIIRLAEWFGVSAVWLSSESVDPFHPKVVRASMGSFFRVGIGRAREWETLLGGFGGRIVLAALRGYSPEAIDWREVKGLYLGSEGQGAHRAPPEAIPVCIPRAPTARADSLNVATAAAILLYCWRVMSG